MGRAQVRCVCVWACVCVCVCVCVFVCVCTGAEDAGKRRELLSHVSLPIGHHTSLSLSQASRKQRSALATGSLSVINGTAVTNTAFGEGEPANDNTNAGLSENESSALRAKSLGTRSLQRVREFTRYAHTQTHTYTLRTGVTP